MNNKVHEVLAGKSYEVLEINSISMNNGEQYNCKDITLWFRAIDIYGKELDLSVDIDTVEFLRWFNTSTINDLKKKAIDEINNL